MNPDEHLPKFFGKSGHPDADPTKAKKNGGGKGNWGREGDELEDYSYNLTKPRRRSNSSTAASGYKDFKTKFETVEPDPVFEEEIHGSSARAGTVDLDKESTNSSNGSRSIEEEEGVTNESCSIPINV